MEGGRVARWLNNQYYIIIFVGGHGLTSAKCLLIVLKKMKSSTLLCEFISVLSGRVEANFYSPLES